MGDILAELMDRYSDFDRECRKPISERCLANAESLLEEIVDSGKVVEDSDQRDILSGLARELGDLVFSASGRYPAVRLKYPADLEEELHPPQKSFFLVPFRRNANFVGRRDEMGHLHQALMGEAGVGIRPVGLTGMGGVGKTQLAVEYAYCYREDYPGGILWIDAARSLSRGLTNLAKLLEPRAADLSQDGQIYLAFKQLKKLEGALLIVDDLSDPADLYRSLGAGFVLETIPCRILFTTRRQDFDHYRRIEIAVLLEELALKLLLRHPKRRPILDPGDPQHSQAQEICAILGCLPLALEIASAHLGRQPEVGLEVYRQELLRRGALPVLDDDPLRPEELSTRHSAGVAATLASQWEILEDDDNAQIAQDAKLLLRVAGQLQEAAQIPGARLGLLAGVSGREAGFFKSDLELALRELMSISLMQALREGHVRLHPLVREFAIRKTPKEKTLGFRRDCAKNLADAYEDMANMEGQARARGVYALQEDLIVGLDVLAPTSKISSDLGLTNRLEHLLGLLQLETHHLQDWDSSRWPAFFGQQVHNRAVDLGMDRLAGLARDRLAEVNSPSLLLLWRASPESPALVRTLTGHSGSVTATAILPNGRQILSASEDGTLKIWDLDTGEDQITLEGHEDKVYAVAATPDGKQAVSAANDDTLRIWDLATGRERGTLSGHDGAVYAVAVAPDGRRAVSASDDRTLRVWNLATGRELLTLRGHTSWIRAVAATPDGQRIVSGSDDKTLRIWDLETGQELLKWQGHHGKVLAVALTPDGQRIISGSADREVKVWELATGEELATFRGHKGMVSAVAVSPDGQQVVSASSDWTLRVWDLSSGEEQGILQGHQDWVGAVAVTPATEVISGSEDETLRVWNLARMPHAEHDPGEAGWVRAVAVAPDLSKSLEGSPIRDSRVLSASGKTLKICDLATGFEEAVHPGHDYDVIALTVTPDGHRAVSGDYGGTIKVWDLAQGRDIITIQTIKGHSACVRALTVTPNGQHVVSASDDGTLKIWDPETGQELARLTGHELEVYTVAVTPDGRRIISGSGDKTLRVWDLASRQEMGTLLGHTDSVRSVGVTPDGRRAISGCQDGTLGVWDLESYELQAILSGHGDQVRALRVTPDGRQVVSASWDKTLRIWDLDTGTEVARVAMDGAMECLALSRHTAVVSDGDEESFEDGVIIVAGDHAGSVYCLQPGFLKGLALTVAGEESSHGCARILLGWLHSHSSGPVNLALHRRFRR